MCEFFEFLGKFTARKSQIWPIIRKSDPITQSVGLISKSTQAECGKIRTRTAPNTDTFHAVIHTLQTRAEIQILIIIP